MSTRTKRTAATCSSCRETFLLTNVFFYKNYKTDKFDSYCKACRKQYNAKRNLANRKISDIPEGFKKCTKCTQILPKTQEYFQLSEGKYFWGACNPCRTFGRRERDKAYYESTRDLQAERRKSYRNSRKEITAEWDKNNYGTPWGRYRHYRGSAKDRDIGFEISFEEFQLFWQKPCHYCADPIDKIGLDRVDPTLGYIVSNLVSCCKNCNFAKHLFSQDEYIAHCEKVINNFKSKRRLVAV